jgi:hypothetical protein
LELIVELKEDEFLCDGCNTVKHTDHLGGYRCLCESCVAAMPPIPKAPSGTGFWLDGQFPDFRWKAAE